MYVCIYLFLIRVSLYMLWSGCSRTLCLATNSQRLARLCLWSAEPEDVSLQSRAVLVQLPVRRHRMTSLLWFSLSNRILCFSPPPPPLSLLVD